MIGVSTSILKNFGLNIKEALSNTRTIEIKLPSNVLHRTELMCIYISEEIKDTFTINDFLMLLYLDFVKYAIKNYNPKRVLKEAMRKNELYQDDELTIVINDKTYIANKNSIRYSYVDITMSKSEIRKGEIILDELYDLYKFKIPFEVLLSNLWINFIEDYQNGTNKRAYTSIVKLLKQVY